MNCSEDAKNNNFMITSLLKGIIMKITNNILLLPSTTIDVEHILENAGKSKSEIIRIINTTGFSKLCYALPKLYTEFVFEGLNMILQKHLNFFDNIDAIIVVSQTYDQRIPSISSRIQGRFNIKNGAFCIDVIDGCAGYIKALSIARMLGDRGHEKILIVAGDLNSVITSNAELSTKILFGDGISVSTLESDTKKIQTRLFNNGDNSNVISCSIKENLMRMNGFEVFRFTKNVVPKLIESFLEEESISLRSFDLLALHQASKLVVNSISKSIVFKNNYSDDFTCGEIGNLGAGSIGAWLANIKDLDQKRDFKMLAVGFGSGLSWGLASIVVHAQVNEVVYV
jgi:3-oxoacyl-[acyl-carrier-protein] synthase-3